MRQVLRRCLWLWMSAWLCALALWLAPAHAQTLPAPVRATLPEVTLVGGGLFRWFGLSLYHARLWGDKKNLTAANWAQNSFALELEYTRRLYGDRIASASLDEIKKLGIGTPAQHTAWLAAMKQLFPDVDEGTQLTGVYTPGQPTRFFRDGTAIGEISDPEFGPAFFGIWLHPKTSAPKLRNALLGLK